MMTGIIEMHRLCAKCLDSANMAPLLHIVQTMVPWWTISLWMMSTVLVQKKLLKTAVIALQIIVEAVRELGSFAGVPLQNLISR